jgi:hypothetical protein
MMRWRASIACDNPARAFDDHDLGGYRIANGVAPFIGGRSELHGEKFLVDHNAACRKIQAARSPRLLAKSPCRRYRHHLRKSGALHTIEPAVDPKAK